MAPQRDYGSQSWAFVGPGLYLDTDIAGNAILAFIDDHLGSEQVAAYLVSPDGVLLWASMVFSSQAYPAAYL